jgi:Rieske Fe-S protein
MSDPHPAPPPERRSFLKWACHGLGALFGALLGAPAVAYLIDARNRSAPPSDFKTVARLDELEKDVPFQAVVRAVRRDAWTLHPNDVVGRVWLIRRADSAAGKPVVEAFTTICPHLGCSVNYEAKDKRFLCPCHGGQFDLDGKRLEQPGVTNPAPRGMDPLECNVEQGLIEVKYVNFRQGEHERVPKT